MPHNESQSVSRVKENFKHGLTGRDWRLVNGSCNKSLRYGESDDNTVSTIQRQSFTLLVVLTQILAESIEQLIQIESVVKNGSDTYSFLQDINSGIREGLTVMQMLNPKFNAGLYGNLSTADSVLSIITNLYGSIPQTSEYRLQQAQDQSVAESIAMNGTLFQFADQADAESRQIFDHSQVVSPQGAEKLTAQSIAVLIGVTTQMLRTNSMMLKMMSEDMALRNRDQKIQSQQFRAQYDGLSDAIGKLPSDTTLAPLDQ